MNKISIYLFIYLSILYAPNLEIVIHNSDYDNFEYYWNGILETETNKTHIKNWKIVISHKGALGIAQVMPNTFDDILRWSGRKDLKQKDIMIRKHNLWAGKWYFSNCYFNQHRQDLNRAISSYNMGKDSDKINWSYIGKVKSNARVFNE